MLEVFAHKEAKKSKSNSSKIFIAWNAETIIRLKHKMKANTQLNRNPFASNSSNKTKYSNENCRTIRYLIKERVRGSKQIIFSVN